MSDRAARAARERYIDLLRRCTACITPSVMLVAPRDASGIWQAKFATNPARLPTAPQFTVEITHEFAYQPMADTESSSIHTTGYRYELSQSDGRELFAYHLHPAGTSTIKIPHLHVGMHDPDLNYGKKHLPTGLVSLPEIILCLITEYAVRPLRPDWQDILQTASDTLPRDVQD